MKWEPLWWVPPAIGVSILAIIACIPLFGMALRGDFKRKKK